MSRYKNTSRAERKPGAPCLCTSTGHGHDDIRRCGKPVMGYTRSGRLKKICDDCAHEAQLRKLLKDDAPSAANTLERTTALAQAPAEPSAAELGRAPAPPPRPQVCPACGKTVQPAYWRLHQAGKDIYSADCPLHDIGKLPDIAPTAAPQDEDIVRLKF